jgi:putative membrane protein
MHTGNRYKLKEFLYWTRRDIYAILIWALIPTSLYYFLELKWLAVPWARLH